MDNYREEIKEIDKQILDLLAERAKFSVKVGQHKKENGLEFIQPEVEEKIFKMVSEIAKEKDLDSEAIKDLWRKIIDMSIEIQKKQ
jgi:chorismate mutase